MTQELLLEFINENMLNAPPYVLDETDCEWWVRKIYKLDGIEFDQNPFIAMKDFELVTDHVGELRKLQLMDVVVFRGRKQRRHVGVMIDNRWFTHFSEQTGIEKTEITRDVHRNDFLHAGRHKIYANPSGQ